MPIRAFEGKLPAVDPSAFIEESAQVIGEVTIGASSSIWFNTVVRGDVNFIRIGEQTNVQDLCCLHVTHDRHSLTVGDRVTVGHGVTLHGCRVGDDCLIGIGAIVLDGCEIGAGSLVAAGSLVVPGTLVPPQSLVMGAPAKVKRSVTPEERTMIAASAAGYLRYVERYRAC
jgi:carbonic anhydrase/acetyltransferase-like protein (isoleucine patch superfamily)